MNETKCGAIVGYARTSGAQQIAGLEAQESDLKAVGCERIFAEHVSSVDAIKPQLRAALDWCRDGDTLVVTRPCRLARNVGDLLKIVEGLKARGVTLRILSVGVDTATANGVLTLQVFAAVAQWERSVMLERQAAGIAKAKAEGKFKGRAPTARAKAAEVHRLIAAGCRPAEIVKITNISRASYYRIAKGMLNNNFIARSFSY